MQLTWLEDFLALAEQRNFSRAAQARHVTQPAFSRRIQSLEDWIGAPLFLRTPRGVLLSPAGEFLRTHAEVMTRNIYQLRREALAIAGQATDGLTIAATHALSFTFFPGWIRAHAPLDALGTLNLVSDSMEACERIMLRGEANFLLSHHHPAAETVLDPHQFMGLAIGEDVLVPLCAPNAEGAPSWRVSDTGEPARYLAYSAQSGLGRIVTACWAAAPTAPVLETVFTSRLAAALLTMARQGQGVAWLPRSLAVDDIARGDLIDAGEGRWSIPIGIRLARPTSRLGDVAEQFWRHLIDVRSCE